ncbi:GNAT family N-acetyltransferase [Woodsholea maritima]|uniref:GNAT family N-acetyltransferase n=1 Tax=Woodsholea maritima TaxID=240237 RepID=UPI000376783C|nr:GNAT family N-acetyltransferase [Woodsholea maritima]
MDQIVVKTPKDLSEAERQCWRDFLKTDALYESPYFALGFLDAMAKVRSDTRVALIYRAGALIAFLPYHQVSFGYARPLGGPLGDHHGLIQAPDVIIDLEHVFSEAGIGVFDFFGGFSAQRSFAPYTTRHDGSWVIDVSEGYEAFVETRRQIEPKAMRNIRNRRRKLETEGALTFTIEDQREAIFDTALEWKGAQYDRSGHVNVFTFDWTRNLLKELIWGEYEGVKGVMSSLEIDGQMVAAHIGMKSDTVLHYWFPVYDGNFHKLSPGLNLLMAIAEDQSAKGVKALHLGPGEYDFKQHLSSYQFPLISGFVATPSWIGLARRSCHAVENVAESLDAGLVSRLPGKVFRRIDRMFSFKGS